MKVSELLKKLRAASTMPLPELAAFTFEMASLDPQNLEIDVQNMTPDDMRDLLEIDKLMEQTQKDVLARFSREKKEILGEQTVPRISRPMGKSTVNTSGTSFESFLRDLTKEPAKQCQGPWPGSEGPFKHPLKENSPEQAKQVSAQIDKAVMAQREKNKTDARNFQSLASKTAIYPENLKILYPALGLAGEAGEVANKVKKIYRDEKELTDEVKEEIGKEIGDVMWYCAALATDLGLDLNKIGSDCIKRLENRKKNGTIKGDGDDR